MSAAARPSKKKPEAAGSPPGVIGGVVPSARSDEDIAFLLERSPKEDRKRRRLRCPVRGEKKEAGNDVGDDVGESSAAALDHWASMDTITQAAVRAERVSELVVDASRSLMLYRFHDITTSSTQEQDINYKETTCTSKATSSRSSTDEEDKEMTTMTTTGAAGAVCCSSSSTGVSTTAVTKTSTTNKKVFLIYPGLHGHARCVNAWYMAESFFAAEKKANLQSETRSPQEDNLQSETRSPQEDVNNEHIIVYAVDYPGHGGARGVARGLIEYPLITDIATMAAAQVQAWHPDRDLHCAAMSMGGAILLSVVTKYGLREKEGIEQVVDDVAMKSEESQSKNNTTKSTTAPATSRTSSRPTTTSTSSPAAQQTSSPSRTAKEPLSFEEILENPKKNLRVRSVILTAPLIAPYPLRKAPRFALDLMSRAMNKLIPRVAVAGGAKNKKTEELLIRATGDVTKRQECRDDLLHHKGGCRAGTAHCALQLCLRNMDSAPTRMRIPCLALVAEDDAMVDDNAVKPFFASAKLMPSKSAVHILSDTKHSMFCESKEKLARTTVPILADWFASFAAPTSSSQEQAQL
ncbi:unnamed protein product [Amoebophrya sp. A25]|nr:unnamed protein product [Amoebophrya sp. A25]|eukprot:GSA25T00012400001.1